MIYTTLRPVYGSTPLQALRANMEVSRAKYYYPSMPNYPLGSTHLSCLCSNLWIEGSMELMSQPEQSGSRIRPTSYSCSNQTTQQPKIPSPPRYPS
ncbi:hypothetical protein E2C01_000690 [Portunus trituberculatus]|uniref:Uncharacterized protein n=1 Tax=Portunus trituberculatus TaxID=210409 RepID=A0A5B7CFQ5_PORTR|nr:hypothetical protein [Portunus trituberculatus]